MVTVRRIGLDEGTLYRDMRLASLADSPDAFSTTLESANKRSLESWTEQADSAAAGRDSAIFLAFIEAKPVGIAALYRDAEDQTLGEVVQVWVIPDRRGSRVAGELLDAVVSWARDSGFEGLSAWVNGENRRAARFFGKHGFQMTGRIEPFRPESVQVSRLMTRTV